MLCEHHALHVWHIKADITSIAKPIVITVPAWDPIVSPLMQVDGVEDVEASNALEEGRLIVAATPDTLIRNLMEAVRKLVALASFE